MTSAFLQPTRTTMNFFRLTQALAATFALVLLNACQTVDPDAPARAALNAAILTEKPGDYFIGRRMYKTDYKMWGWIREPGKPWTSARLVMLNEQKKLAPDRTQGKIGLDNNFIYRLNGKFSGETVYEPASDRFYPEFVLEGYELISTKPEPIYVTNDQGNPDIRIIMKPGH
jgi:hypothetical protein